MDVLPQGVEPRDPRRENGDVPALANEAGGKEEVIISSVTESCNHTLPKNVDDLFSIYRDNPAAKGTAKPKDDIAGVCREILLDDRRDEAIVPLDPVFAKRLDEDNKVGEQIPVRNDPSPHAFVKERGLIRGMHKEPFGEKDGNRAIVEKSGTGSHRIGC